MMLGGAGVVMKVVGTTELECLFLSDAHRDETNQQEQRSCETLLLPMQLDLARQMVHYGYNPQIDIGR